MAIRVVGSTGPKQIDTALPRHPSKFVSFARHFQTGTLTGACASLMGPWSRTSFEQGGRGSEHEFAKRIGRTVGSLIQDERSQVEPL